MCCVVRYFSFLFILLIAIANSLPENDDNDMNSPLPDTIPLDYFDEASSTKADQLKTDPTLKRPEELLGPNVIPLNWFYPFCETAYTLCCSQKILNPLKIALDFFGLKTKTPRYPVLFGCINCMPCVFNLSSYM